MTTRSREMTLAGIRATLIELLNQVDELMAQTPDPRRDLIAKVAHFYEGKDQLASSLYISIQAHFYDAGLKTPNYAEMRGTLTHLGYTQKRRSDGTRWVKDAGPSTPAT